MSVTSLAAGSKEKKDQYDSSNPFDDEELVSEIDHHAAERSLPQSAPVIRLRMNSHGMSINEGRESVSEQMVSVHQLSTESRECFESIPSIESMESNESNECIECTECTKNQSAFSQSEHGQDDSESTKQIETEVRPKGPHANHYDDDDSS